MANTKRVKISKSDETDNRVHELTEIEPQFVSLVTAGANRQKSFQVVKSESKQNKNKSLSNTDGDKKSQANKNADTNSSDDADLAAWLDEASTNANALLDDAIASTAFLETEDVLPHVNKDKKEQVGKSQDAQSVEQLLAKSKELETTIAKEREQRIGLEKSRDALTIEVSQLKKERDKIRGQLSKLRNGVGGSTALVTGNVNTDKGNDDNDAPRSTAWSSGGDLAATETSKKSY